jgi:hypothetical protein
MTALGAASGCHSNIHEHVPWLKAANTVMPGNEGAQTVKVDATARCRIMRGKWMPQATHLIMC